MKLLHLMNYKPLGTRAFDHFILEYAKQATARGWDVMFGFTAEPPAEFAQQLSDAKASWVLFEAPLTWRSAKTLRKQLADRKPDVLQTSFLSAFEKPLLWLKLSGFVKKLIVIDHSSGEGPPPNSRLAFLRKLRGTIVGRIVDAVVCVSTYNAKRDIHRVFLPVRKIAVVPNGIDLARFPFSDHVHTSPLKVVYIGQLIPEKGVLTLLEAAKLLANLDFEILIAGSGPQREELETFAKLHSLSRVKFLGHVADVAGLSSSAGIVVVPSEWAEAFGFVAIEAMACGAAIITSDAGALPEVVGDAGAIFPRGNAVEFAAKLREMLADDPHRRRFAELGRRRVEDCFQLHDCVRKHLDIVDSLA